VSRLFPENKQNDPTLEPIRPRRNEAIGGRRGAIEEVEEEEESELPAAWTTHRPRDAARRATAKEIERVFLTAASP